MMRGVTRREVEVDSAKTEARSGAGHGDEAPFPSITRECLSDCLSEICLENRGFR